MVITIILYLIMMQFRGSASYRELKLFNVRSDLHEINQSNKEKISITHPNMHTLPIFKSNFFTHVTFLIIISKHSILQYSKFSP